MCSPCISFVQFPGIVSTDTVDSINGLSTSGSPSVDNLVSTNPMFFYYFGLTGVQTLCTTMIVEDVDLIIAVTRGKEAVSCTAVPVYIKDHPIHAPH